MNTKIYALAALLAIALVLAAALAPSQECTRHVAADGQTLTCAQCGRLVGCTFDGLCDMCASE